MEFLERIECHFTLKMSDYDTSVHDIDTAMFLFDRGPKWFARAGKNFLL
jgi:hypothetical protein